MFLKKLLPLAFLLTGVVNAGAAPAAIWSGKSGGYTWVWTSTDVTATRNGFRRPALSLRKALETGSLGADSTTRSATVLSVVGPLVSVRVDDFITGGAHPTGESWYQTFDARFPNRKVTLTDYIPYSSLKQPLFTDRVVNRLLKNKGRRTAPETSGQLERLIKNETFQVKAMEYAFSDQPLSEFSFHHLEGERVAIRLNVSWSYEAHRFHTTEIGLLAEPPRELANWLEAASSGREGFLRRTGAARFKDRSATLFEWTKLRPPD